MSKLTIDSKKAEKIVDLIYNAIRFYTKDFSEYSKENGILTLYSSADHNINLVGEYKSDTVNFIYEFPFSIMRDGSLTINIKDILNDRKTFFKKQIKSIHLNIEDDFFSLKITNSALNSLTFDFEFVSDLDRNWYSEIKNNYNTDGRLIYSRSASDFSSFVLNNYVEKMVRAQLNIVTLSSFDNGPVVVVRRFKREDMINSLNYLRDLLENQRYYSEKLKEGGEKMSVDYVSLIEKDISIIEKALEEDKDEYHVITNITIMRKPETGNPELDDVLNDLLRRIYITMDIEKEHIVIYPNELFYITSFYLIDNFEESYINIYHNDITNRRTVSIDFFDGVKIISKMPSPELLFDINKMILVAGIRPEPDITGLTDDRVHHIKKVLFDSDINLLEENYSNIISDSSVLFSSLKDFVNPDLLNGVMDKIKSLKEELNNRHNFYEIFSEMFAKNIMAQ
ncbi:MAG: hypothetical protein QXF12_00680 [Candidatus Aenigmatarchaeota archaeon]